jgi:phosphate transport system substrate-binding protein
MKKIVLTALSVLAMTAVFTGCQKEEWRPKIAGLTLANYPYVDGSTTTIGLQHLIACKLLGYRYEWRDRSNAWGEGASLEGAYAIGPAGELPTGYWEKVKSSKTHNSIINVIDGTVGFSITARTMSDSEKAYADAAGVTLVETPIALDAFVFIIHPDNPVKELTTQQIRDIYTGKLTNWKEVGGNDAPINPYRRPADSGSQELMETLVMQWTEMMDIPDEHNMFSMMGVYHALANDPNGLCYTVYYYNEFMVRDKIAKPVAVDGVFPDDGTVRRRDYPYTSEVYAVVRDDLDRQSMAYKIYEMMLGDAGKRLVAESGYVPYEK